MGCDMKIGIVILFFVVIFSKNIYAADDPVSEYDFTEIDKVMGNETDFDFESSLREIISGDFENGFGNILDMLLNNLFGELRTEKNVIIKIIVIGLVAALFSNITGGILFGKISETGFYITYMSLVVCVITGYSVVAELVKRTMEKLSVLMEAITPVYILSIGFSTGKSSATGFYQIIIIVISIIEKVLLKFVIPLIYMYMILNVINNMMDGKMFTKSCELIKIITEWILKTIMSFVIGINIIRSLINPIVDSLKMGTMWKVLQSIPGVGNSLNPISSIVVASGTLIKNGIGITSMMAIIVVCFVPIVKTALISISYKAVGAILEPVSDKRIVNCLNGVYESIVLLMKTVIYSTIFFVLTIAIICASTSHRIS